MKENEKQTTEIVSEENEKSEKKKIVRQPWWPDWFTGRTINEPIFCREFLKKYRLAYTENSFFSVEGKEAEMATSKGFDNKAEIKILGTDNGCQTSLERFTAPHRKAFFGKCVVVLKGKGTLKAEAVDLKDATLSL